MIAQLASVDPVHFGIAVGVAVTTGLVLGAVCVLGLVREYRAERAALLARLAKAAAACAGEDLPDTTEEGTARLAAATGHTADTAAGQGDAAGDWIEALYKAPAAMRRNTRKGAA